MRTFLSITILIVFSFRIATSQIIADALPGCLSIDMTAGVNCNGASPGNIFFDINGANQFQVQNIYGSMCCNVGGDHSSFFDFEQVDISGYSNVGISIDYSASNTAYEDSTPAPQFGCTNNPFIDGSHDQIVFAYILDGSETQDLIVTGTTAADFTGTWSVSGLNGNTLKVKVYATNKATAEIFYFENLIIDGTPDVVDAGPDQSVCDNSVITLDGTGAGVWSGGTGTFADPTDPDTDYTPGPGEEGATVTLTYSGNPATAACGMDYPPSSEDVDLTFSAPTATLTYNDPAFNGQFCSGDCATIDVAISGGTPLYTLDMVFGAGPINFPFPIPGFDVNDNITICYNSSAFIPDFDPATNTITVPGLANGFSGNLDLNGITDDNGCFTALSESVTASFQTSPDISSATLSECADEFGIALFELNDALPQLDVTTGATVTYWDDVNMSNQILPPYSSAGETIYAFAELGGCFSNAPLNLIALPTGDVGTVEFYCEGSSTQCLDICDSGGDGELIDLTIILNDPGSTYEVEIFTSPGGSSIYTVNGGTQTIQTFVNGYTTFEVISIIQDGLCPDQTDLGSIVEVDLVIPPIFDDPGMLSGCNDISLPPISGVNVPSDAMYYSEQNGMGDIYAPGAIFTMSDTLYIYGGVPGCDDQVEVFINVGGNTTYDQPTNVVECGSYLLPSISGDNVGPTAAYFTGMNGSGTQYNPGDNITMSSTLFIYDPNSSCQNNQPSFTITISAGPQIDSIVDVLACTEFILPAIEPAGILSGNEAYFTGPGATGVKYEIGDTLTSALLNSGNVTDSVLIYAYDSTATCQTQQSFWVVLEYQPFPGIGDTLQYCGSGSLELNLPALLSGTPDSLGQWMSSSPSIIINDSTSVNLILSALIEDEYALKYNITADSVCSDTSSTLLLQIFKGPDAGFGSNLNACANTTSADLTDLLIGSDPGGVWVVDPMVGIDLVDPTNVDLSQATTDNFSVFYKIEATEDCPADSTEIAINLIPVPNAGMDNSSNVCTGVVVDLVTLLDGQSSTGSFVDVSASGNLAGSIFTTSGLVGSYDFYHIVESPNTVPSCGNSDVNANIWPCVPFYYQYISIGCPYLAGDKIFVTFNNALFTDPQNALIEIYDRDNCDLSTVLVGTNIDMNPVDNGDGTSTSEITLTGATTPDISILLSDAGINPYADFGPITIEGFPSSVSPAIPCPPDSALITINVSTTANAGDDVQAEVCDPESPLLLSSLITNGDAGGVFVRNGTMVPNEIFPVDYGTGSTFLYIVGDDVTCPRDTAIITLNNVPFSFSILTNPQGICPGRGQIVTIPFTSDRDYRIYFSVTNTITGNETFFDRILELGEPNVGFFMRNQDNGIENGTDLEPNQRYVVNVDSIVALDGSCVILPVNQFFFVQTVDELQFELDTILCPGEVIDTFGFVFTRDTLIVAQTNFGCDSIIDISIDYYEIDTLFAVETICDGSTRVFGGEEFSMSRTTGTVVLNGMSSVGCDSIIVVDLTYQDANEILINDVICGGATIEIAGNVYDADNSTGMETLPGSNGECDTIYTIDLQIGGVDTSTVDDQLCSGAFLTIGGEVFDEGRPIGEVLLMNEAGCDSLILVDLTFASETIIDVTDPICEGDTIVIAGTLYYVGNSMDELTVPGMGNDCDTVYQIALLEAAITTGEQIIYACDMTEVFSFGGQTFDINNSSGTYLFGPNAAGCDSLVNLEIFYDQLGLDITYVPAPCDEVNSFISIDNVSSQNLPLDVMINGDILSVNTLPIEIVLASGNIDLTITDSQGCSFDLDTTIMSTPPSFEINTSVNAQGTQLSISGNAEIDEVVWSPRDGLSCFDCLAPIANPALTTTYIAEVFYADGLCSELLTITVRVQEIIEVITLPNIISAGGNSNNGVFYVKADPEEYSVARMLIYDRWGNKVFDVSNVPAGDPSFGWDGTFQGQEAQQGVYIYYIELSTRVEGQENLIRKGDLALIR